MTDDLCPLLDDYLLGELPDETRTRFEAHLAECETCRSKVEQQAAVDEAVKGAADSIAFPSGLTVRVCDTIEQAQRRRRIAIAMCCAAGVAGIAFSIWSVVRPDDRSNDAVDQRQIVKDEIPPQKSIAPLPNPEPEAPVQRAPQETVQIEFSSDVVALRVESGDPDVTLYQVFPTVGARAATP